MKNILITTLSILMTATVASASCKGGQPVARCYQLSAPIAGKIFSASVTMANQYNVDQITLIKAGDYGDRVDCSVDVLKLDNSQPKVCQSALHSYTILNSVSDKLQGNDPYLLGALLLIGDGASMRWKYGFISENLQTKEKNVFGCQQYIQCPQ